MGINSNLIIVRRDLQLQLWLLLNFKRDWHKQSTHSHTRIHLAIIKATCQLFISWMTCNIAHIISGISDTDSFVMFNVCRQHNAKAYSLGIAQLGSATFPIYAYFKYFISSSSSWIFYLSSINGICIELPYDKCAFQVVYTNIITLLVI